VRINIIGAECTGKTTLANSLADYFKSPLVGEYAREYVRECTNPINSNDVLNIANQQISEFESIFNSKMVIYDTSLITSVIWLYDKFKITSIPLHTTFLNQHFDITILCYPDLPWVKDDQRSDENRLMDIHRLYVNYLETNNKDFFLVTGIGEERFNNALNAILDRQNNN
jgi:nicotinamide riboside kinase